MSGQLLRSGKILQNMPVSPVSMPDNGENSNKKQRHSSYKHAINNMGTIQELLSGSIDEEDFRKSSTDEKLDILASQFNRLTSSIDKEIKSLDSKLDVKLRYLENAIDDEDTGIRSKLGETSYSVEEMSESYKALAVENEDLKKQVSILRGTVHKQEKQIQVLKGKQTSLVAKSMEKNLVISGIPELPDSSKENCRKTVSSFLQAEMDIGPSRLDIKNAYRIGVLHAERPRQIVIRVPSDLWQWIMDNLGRLRGRKNSMGKGFFITPQLPDQWVEQRRTLKDQIRRAQDKVNKSEAHIPPKDRSTVETHRGQLFINKVLQKEKIHPPSVLQLTDMGDQEIIEDVQLIASDPDGDKGSSFQAFAAVTKSLNEVRNAYKKVRQSNPAADHVVLAYTCREGDGLVDDGENGAGTRLLDKLLAEGVNSRAIFMVRIFGGAHLGPKRFQIMEKLGQQALRRLQSEVVEIPGDVNGDLPSSQESTF